MNYHKAYEIASVAHIGQKDKGGYPYIQHPIAVASMFQEEEEKIVAILHDVVEDTLITLEYLKFEGFSDVVIRAIDSLTRVANETYQEYLIRVKENDLATTIKIKDIEHNMDLSRIPKPTKRDLLRIQKYRNAKAFLTS